MYLIIIMTGMGKKVYSHIDQMTAVKTKYGFILLPIKTEVYFPFKVLVLLLLKELLISYSHWTSNSNKIVLWPFNTCPFHLSLVFLSIFFYKFRSTFSFS